MAEGKKGGNFWLGFFLGGLFGAFIIFVLGTKEGKRLTEKLLENAELKEEELEEKIAKLQKHGEDLFSEAQQVKDKVVKDIVKENKTITDTFVAKMDNALSKIEDIQRKGVALTKEVHHHYFKKNGKPLTS